MKKVFFLISAFLLISFSANCKKIPGYIITHEADTLFTLMKVSVGWFSGNPSFNALQSKVIYYTEDGKKQVLRPADAREVGIIYKGDTTRFLSRPNNLAISTSLFHDDGYIFLKLEEDGLVKLFSYEVQNHSGGFGAAGAVASAAITYSYDRYVLQYNKLPLQQVRGISFRRDMMEFFSDCPELVEKIDQRIYRKQDLQKIVKEYNHYRLGSAGPDAATQKKSGF